MKIIFIAFLAVVLAEPPVPEGFAGYERGGYEIQSGNTGTYSRNGPSQFPGSSQGLGNSQFPSQSEASGSSSFNIPGDSSSGFGGSPSSNDFASGQIRDNQGEFQQNSLNDFQRGSQRFQPIGNDNGNQGNEDGNEGGGDYDEESGGDLDDIPGEAGKDFPIYGEIPKTSFSCDNQAAPGYYADVETQCQVFHICQKGGQMNSVLCPNGTIFNQRVFVCSWWYDFDCDQATGLFSRNEEVNAEGEEAAGRSREGNQYGGQKGGRDGGYSNGGDGYDGGKGYSDNGPSGGPNSVISQSIDQILHSEESFIGAESTGGLLNNGLISGISSIEKNSERKSGSGSHLDNNSQNGGSGGGYARNGENSGSKSDGVDFEGYSDNGPSERASGQSQGRNTESYQGNDKRSRGASRFGQKGSQTNGKSGDAPTGFSNQGPVLGLLQGIQNDLATSGDHPGTSDFQGMASSGYPSGKVNADQPSGHDAQATNIQNNGDASQFDDSGRGYPRSRNGNARREGSERNTARNHGFQSGQANRDDGGSSGYPSGPSGSGSAQFGSSVEGSHQPGSIRGTNGGGTGREDTRSRQGVSLEAPSSDYLPPKESAPIVDSSGDSARSYLTPQA